MNQQIEAAQKAWMVACGEGDVLRMARESERLERLQRVARATKSARRLVAAIKIRVSL